MDENRTQSQWWEKMEKTTLDLHVVAQYFELYNRTEGKSPKTVLWYNNTLSRLERFLQKRGKSTRFVDIGEMEVREFILDLQERRRWQESPYIKSDHGNLAAITVQTYVRALRAFFSWAYREDFAAENRLAKLKPPKAPTRVADILSGEEMTRVLKSIKANNPTGARNYAMLLLFFDTGLRCSELRDLRLPHINLDGGYLKVMGKGGKERIVPFGGSAQKTLLRYALQFRPTPMLAGIDNLFLTLDGRPMTMNCVRMTFKRIARGSGVTRLHPHLCRHTFATTYLVNGGDVFSLQQILGHTTLEMVRRYVSLASTHVTMQHRKYSPMDRLMLAAQQITNSKITVGLPSILSDAVQGNENRKKRGSRLG